MKKRMIVTVVTVSLAALLFVGCSAKKEDPAVKPDESQTTQTPETKPETLPETPAETPEATDGQIGKLASLMGKTDEDVIAALGEGTPAADEAGTVTARDVETKLFDKAVTVSAAFDTGKVSMLIVYANEGDMAFWTEQATAELGEPDSNDADSTEGGDSKSLTWNLDDGAVLTVREAYGAVSLELIAGA